MPAGRPRLDQQLSHCREEGVSCHECVQRAASAAQRICSDMTPSLARQLFPILYPESVCGRMSGSFVQAAASRKEPQRIPRRMPGREMPVPETPVRELPVYEMPGMAAAVA